MSLRALRLRCAEAAVWTDGFKAYRTEEKWNEMSTPKHVEKGEVCNRIIILSFFTSPEEHGELVASESFVVKLTEVLVSKTDHIL